VAREASGRPAEVALVAAARLGPRDGSLEEFDVVPHRAPPRQRLQPVVDRRVVAAFDRRDRGGIRVRNAERLLEVGVLREEVV
jgi:hypothetical protein